MNFAMTEEQALLTATLRRFTEKELRTWAPEADRQAQAPEQLFSKGGDLGLFVDAVPEDQGGLLDGRFEHLSRALRGLELGRGCAALASLLECNVEPALAIARWGSPALQSELFALMAEGALIATAHDSEGRLRIEASERVQVSGSLSAIPAGAKASHLLLLTDELVALVPASAARIEAVETSGWRAGAWASWSFDDHSLPAEHILARGPAAREAREQILSWANISLAARALGVATAAIEYATAYAQERHQFGQAIADFESIIRLRDKNETAIRAARLLVLEAASLADRDDPTAVDHASRARDLAGDIVTRATIDAVQIYGGYGFVNDYPVEKLMRDARAFEVLHGNAAFQRVLMRRQGDN